ncbi:hypothetical protein C2845_PM02G17970 [Panicum miliaceum]|uniref:Retrotransposon gag domain-containing protein n=1 Tax=Panicum miliaceum TaxID=4540 RepID=A0A3L6S5P1_PANMI|nr:hypothetical protein C2845_PM02G17970 [Panicum miliaceum]
MAVNSSVFFSMQVMLQIHDVTDYSIVFGSFLEMYAPRSPPIIASASEVESTQGSRSDLTLSSSNVRRVDEISLDDSAHTRTTRRPITSANDLLFGIDQVDRSIPECIELAEAALRRPNDSDRGFPCGLRNSAAVYSDLIRAPLQNFRISDLVPRKIGSELVPEPTGGFQEILFTLPPNRINSAAQRQGEDDETRQLRIRRNESRALRRQNEGVINDVEDEADGRHPRNRRLPPRNLNDDFILECGDQPVFATPSANMAAILEAQLLRKNYSDLRAQSSHCRHSASRPHGEEVDGVDLRANLRNNEDLRPIVNNLHREREEVERERRRSFSAFSNRLRDITWPPIFKSASIDKFDGDSDLKTWLRTYSIAIGAANDNIGMMAAYFPVMMSHQVLNRLEELRAGSINSWQDLCTAFINHFQASLNQKDFDRLLDDKCPSHKDGSHTARECHALGNSVVASDDPKRPRYNDRDKPSRSKGSRSRGRRNNSLRRDRED